MKIKTIIPLLSALALTTGLTGCEGEKDLIIIEGNLPIKTSALYMVGDATPNGWSIDAPTPLDASDEDPLIFTWEGSLNAGEMKLCLTTGSWDSPFIRPEVAGEEIGKAEISDKKFTMHAGDPDDKWKVTEAGIYSLRFDLRNWTMSSTYLREPDAPVIEPIEADALYIVGDATPNGWNIDDPTALEKKSSYLYVYEGILTTGEMKACISTGSWDVQFIRPQSDGCKINMDGVEDNSFVFTTGPDNKWKVEQAGIYRLSFDLSTWTVTCEYVGEYEPAPILYMIGEATDGGWSLDNATEIEATADNHAIFIWEGELGRGTFKASLVKDFGASFYRPATANCEVSSAGVASHDMVFTTGPDDQWLVTEAGKYRLTFNTEEMTFDAVCLDATVKPSPLYMIGEATAGGWSLDNATELAPVEGKEGEYSWTGTLKAGGTFKISAARSFTDPFYRPSSSSCEVSSNGITATDVVYTTDPDDQWKVVTEGKYEITINIKAMTISAKYLD